MSLIRYITLIYLFIQFLAAETLGQEHHFTIHRGSGKIIGEISASLSRSPNIHTYTILSEVNFNVLWKKYHRRTSNLVIYNQQIVKNSHSGIYMNHKVNDSITLTLQSNRYRGYRHPGDTFFLNEAALGFTTAKLYFHEPVGVEKVYSTRFLEYLTLEKQGDHRYKLHLPEGKNNYYIYKDRELVKVLVERAWFDLEFRRRE